MLTNGRKDVNVVLKNNSKQKDKSVQPEPKSLEKLNWLIHLQHIRGQTVQCKQLINSETQRSNGKNEYALFKQGKLLREEGKVQEALESFQACLKLSPQNPDNLKEVAKCLFEMQRFRLSLGAYIEAENFTKNSDWHLYYSIGWCLMKLGDASKAKEYAHRAVKVSKHEESYELLIKILVVEGDLRSAVAVSNAAVESCPDSATLLTESGLLFMKLGQTQQSFERLSQALALDPTCSKALLGVGCITQKHEEYDVALSKYKIAVIQNPDSAALWNNIGLCFYSKQKYVAAISCLKRALWLSPLNWSILFNLGLVHLATQQPASAFNFVCAAVNLRADIGETFAVLGSCLFELNDKDNALKALTQASFLSPDNPYIMVSLAVCCVTTGLTHEAHKSLQRLRASVDDGVMVPNQVLELSEQLLTLLTPESQVPTDNVITETEAPFVNDQPAQKQITDMAEGHCRQDYTSDGFPTGDIQHGNITDDEV